MASHSRGHANPRVLMSAASPVDARAALLCIKGEIHRMLTTLRRHPQLGSHDRFLLHVPLAQETGLMRAFKALYRRLGSAPEDLHALDAVMYLQPFLLVLSSHDASASLTAAALSSINKFLSYGFIAVDAPRACEAANRLCHIVTHCRFEAVSVHEEQITLMALLDVVGNMIRCASGALLSGENVWDAVQCVWTIASAVRDHSHALLRRTAQSTLTHIIMHIFNRLPTLLEREEVTVVSRHGGKAAHAQDVHDEDPRAEEPSDALAGHRAQRNTPHSTAALARILSWVSSLMDPAAADRGSRLLGMELVNVILETCGDALTHAPSLIAVCQADVCKYLIASSRTADLHLLSLALRVVFNLFNVLKVHLKVQLEVFFTSVHLYLADSRAAPAEQRELALESLLEFCREPTLMTDLYVNYDCDVACTNLFETLCRCLCRNAVPDSGTSLTSLHTLSLEGLLSILAAMRSRLDAAVHTEGPTAPPVSRSLDLNASFSAGSDAAMATPRLVALSSGSSADDVMTLPAAAVDTPALHDDVLSSELLDASRQRAADALRKRKQLKQLFVLAAARFNRDQKHWIEYAQELGLLPSPADAASVARFLRECPGLDRELIGLYITEREDAKHAFQTMVRAEFIKLFDFRGLRIDAALRKFLEPFKLPVEAQKIERLMQSFAERVVEHSPGPMQHKDTPFVLAYSIIMLNTDLHNKAVKRKMTVEQFVKNNRGIDDGKDLPPEFLTQIYDSIANKEIILRADVSNITGAGSGPSEDAAAAAAAAHATGADGAIAATVGAHWDGILQRQHAVTAYTSSERRLSVHDKDMFLLIADACVHALSVVLDYTQDVELLRRVTTGLRDCATLAASYGAPVQYNQVIVTLCRSTVRDMNALQDCPDDAQALAYAVKVTRRRVTARERSTATVMHHVTSTAPHHGAARANESATRHLRRQATFTVEGSDSEDEDGFVSRTHHAQRSRFDEDAAVDLSDAATPSDARSEAVATDVGDVEASSVGDAPPRVAQDVSASSAQRAEDAHRPLLSEPAFILRRCLLTLRGCTSLANAHSSQLREAWRNIVELLLKIASFDALPKDLLDLDDVRAPNGMRITSAADADAVASTASGDLLESSGSMLAAMAQSLQGSTRLRAAVEMLHAGRALASRSNMPAPPHAAATRAHTTGARTDEVMLHRPRSSRDGRRRHARSVSPVDGPRRQRAATAEPTLDANAGIWTSFSSLFRGDTPLAPSGDAEFADAVFTCVAADVDRYHHLHELLRSTASISDAALCALLAALAHVRRLDESVAVAAPRAASSDRGAGTEELTLNSIMVVELLVNIALRNLNRFHVVWPVAMSCMHRIAATARAAPRGDAHHTSAASMEADRCLAFVQERAIVGLFRIVVRVLSADDAAFQAVGGASHVDTASPNDLNIGQDGDMPVWPPSVHASPLGVATSVVELCTALPRSVLQLATPRISAAVALLLRMGSRVAQAKEFAHVDVQNVPGTIQIRGDIVRAFHAATFRCMEVCQQYFYASPGVWDVICYAATMGPVAVMAADFVREVEASATPLPEHAVIESQKTIIMLHQHLFALVVTCISRYLHLSLASTSVAALAAAVLFADLPPAAPAFSATATPAAAMQTPGRPHARSMDASEGGIISALQAAFTPHRAAGAHTSGLRTGLRRHHSSPPSGEPASNLTRRPSAFTMSGSGSAATPVRVNHSADTRNEMDIRNVRALNSDILQEMRAVAAQRAADADADLHRVQSYSDALQSLVLDEPLADLRDFTAQAALRVLEQLAACLLPPPLPAAASTVPDACGIAADACWQQLMRLLLAALLHVNHVSGAVHATPVAAALQPLPASLSSELSEEELASLARVRPYLRRAVCTCLQRVIVSAGDAEHAVMLPCAASSWTPVFDNIVYIALGDAFDRIVSAEAKDGVAGCSLDDAEYLLAATNLCVRAYVRALGDLRAAGTLRTVWVRLLVLLLRQLQHAQAHQRGAASTPEASAALSTIADGTWENIKNALLVMHAEDMLQFRAADGEDSLWDVTAEYMRISVPALFQELQQLQVLPIPLPVRSHVAQHATAAHLDAELPPLATMTLDTFLATSPRTLLQEQLVQSGPVERELLAAGETSLQPDLVATSDRDEHVHPQAVSVEATVVGAHAIDVEADREHARVAPLPDHAAEENFAPATTPTPIASDQGEAASAQLPVVLVQLPDVSTVATTPRADSRDALRVEVPTDSSEELDVLIALSSPPTDAGPNALPGTPTSAALPLPDIVAAPVAPVAAGSKQLTSDTAGGRPGLFSSLFRVFLGDLEE